MDPQALATVRDMSLRLRSYSVVSCADMENNRGMSTLTRTSPSRWMGSDWTLAGVLLAAVAGPIATTAAQTPERTPPLPTGQVWQCIREGHKTFSDAPCGASATIRILSEVNVMDPDPRGPIHATRRVAYVAYPAAYRDDRSTVDGADAATAADPVYDIPGLGIVNAGPRGRRPQRLMRPPHRDRAAARAHSGHAAGR